MAGGVGKLSPSIIEVAPFTGSGDMTSSNAKTSFGKDFRLRKITIHFSGPSSNDVKLYIDAKDGAAYDTLEKTMPCSGTQDVVFAPEGQWDYEKGDELWLEWTNDSTLEYGVRVVVEEI